MKAHGFSIFRRLLAASAAIAFDFLGARPLLAQSDLRWVEKPPTSDQGASSQPGDASQSTTQGSSDFLQRVPSAPRSAAYDSLGSSRSAFRDEPLDRGSIRPSTIGNGAARERDRMLSKANENTAVAHDYNIKIGSLLLWFDAGLSLEYSDNITGAGSGGDVTASRFDDRFRNTEFRNLALASGNNRRESDFIILPQVNMHGYMKLTEFNSLNIEMGLGYVKYINHPQFDTSSSLLYVAPGTAISFDVKVGDVFLNFHERPAIPQDQSDLLTLRRTFSYSRFVNSVGVTAFWDIHPILLTLGYDHFNSIALRSELKFLDQSSEVISGSVLYKVSESLSLGIEATTAYVRYLHSDFQNDGVTYSIGPFAELRLTDYLQLRLATGYQGGSFNSGGLNGDKSNPGSYYVSATVLHNLNAYFNHQLSVGHEGQLGTSSNFVDVNYVRYGWNWDILNRVSVGGDAFFEDASESGGFFAQDIRRYGTGIYLSYFLTKKLGVGFHYRFTKRESIGSAPAIGDSLLGYYENRVGLDFHYTF